MYTRTGRSSRASEAVAEEADEGADGDVSAHADGASRRGRRGMWGFAVAFRGPPRLVVACGTPTGTDATPDAIDMAPAPADKCGPARVAPDKGPYPVGCRQAVRPKKNEFFHFSNANLTTAPSFEPAQSPWRHPGGVRAVSSELGAAVGDVGRVSLRSARGRAWVSVDNLAFRRVLATIASRRRTGRRAPPVGQQPTPPDWVG